MGKLNKFQIVIDGHNQVFYPGQTVSGHVIVEVKEELKLRGKHLKIFTVIIFHIININ